MHIEQKLDPALDHLVYAHFVQLLASASLYLPAPQNVHEVCPDLLSAFPASHATQAVLPLDGWYLPAAHSLQVVDPFDA